MLVSRAIPALYGGVSQQPDTQRSDIQLRAMVNSWATVVDGIGKRPPSTHIAKLSNASLDAAYLHLINRDAQEQYEVVITDGDIKVYNLAGVEEPVTFPHGKPYLTVPSGSTARDTFACVTVADYTFVLNKSVVVKQGVLNSDRSAQPVDYFNLNRSPSGGGQGAMYQYTPNPPMGTFYGSVQTLQDLPEGGSEGATYYIRATAESGFAGYYVRRTQGVWIEVTKNDINNTIDAKTMPWALVRGAGGGFTFSPFSWAPRRVGDEHTNPGPSFLGRTLNDVFFMDNRLGFLVDENTVLSRAGDFGNFWRMSVIDLLDDDVVDIAATETKVTKMQHAVPMAGLLMLFSDQVQFRLDKGDFLTPTSGSLTPTTQYPAALKVKPQGIGSDVYFPSEEGGWVRMLEYFVRDDTMVNDAADVTGHVPRLIPQGVRDITGSGEHDALFVISRGAPNRIFHYKWYWADSDTKAQSCWGYWEFGADANVLAVECIADRLIVVVARADGTFLESIPLNATATAPDLPFEIYLDRRLYLQGTYNAAQDRTVFDLPFTVSTDQRSHWRIVRGGGFSVGKGGLADPAHYAWLNESTLSCAGNLTQGKCFLGVGFTQRWTFSRWFMKNNQGMPDLSGRLQIRTVSLYYTRAGFFSTEVAPYGVSPDVEAVVPGKLAEFTGKTLGNAELLVGDPIFDDGVYSFQVYGAAEDAVISITNDSHLGAYFTSAEVEFFWQKRARFA